MTYQINYSFTLRHDPEILFSVNIPLSKLEGKELELETIRGLVDDDSELLLDLLGEQELKVYESMLMAPHLYRKELQRLDESVRIVPVEEPVAAEDENVIAVLPIDAEKVETTLREFISLYVDYDIHKNFEHDEETGDDTYPDLALKFIDLYQR